MTDSSRRGILDGLDAEQRLAAMAVTGPVCIIAGAGTGKTRTVTHRLAHAVASGAIDRGCSLAVTHTAKAAAELKERLVGLGLAGAVDAHTFHAAGLRIASKFWSRTGLSGHGPLGLGMRMRGRRARGMHWL